MSLCRVAPLGVAPPPCSLARAPAALPRTLCFRSTPVRSLKRRLTAMRPPAAGGEEAGGSGAAAAGAEEDAEQQAIRAAAALAADTFLRDEITVGVGTGPAINALLQEIAARQDAGKLRGLKCVPASDVAASEAAFHGVPLTTLQEGQRLDFFFEAADELAADAESCLAFIIGRQHVPQPQLHRARELAAAATTNVVLAPAAVVVPRLGGSLCVAVEEEDWEESGEELDDIFLGDAELWRRSNEEGAGPRGGDNPYVSAEGHALIDIRFYEGLKLFGEDADYGAIAREIEGVPGVVAHGLMANVAAAAIVAGREGEAPRLMWRGDAAGGDSSSA